jgi:signal transduction histidine kinase
MPSRINIAVLCIFLSGSCLSQAYLAQPDINTDSLRDILKYKQREERIDILLSLSKALFHNDPENSKKYADSAFNESRTLQYQEGLAASYRFLGWHAFRLSDYINGLNHLFNSLQFYDEANDKLKIARLNSEIAYFHYFCENYSNSVEYYYKSLFIFRELVNEGEIIINVRDTLIIYTMLGQNYLMMDVDPEQSLKYLIIPTRIIENDNFRTEELVLYNMMAGVGYFNINTDSAEFYFQRALDYPDENLNVQAVKRSVLNSIGLLHWLKGELDSALYYFESNYEWYIVHGVLFQALDEITYMASIYLVKGEADTSLKYFIIAENIFEDILLRGSWFTHDSLENLTTWGFELYFPIPTIKKKELIWLQGRALFRKMFEIYEDKGDIGKALEYHIAYANANDTLGEIERKRETTELQFKFETKQNEKQIELLAQENQFKEFRLRQTKYLLFGLLGLLLLTIMLGVIGFRNYKLREAQKNMLLQQRLLRSQMNPHFLFNALVGIQNFIINEEPALAGKYLSKFSRLVRSILDSTFKDQILLADEIQTLEHYLELQKIRFPGKFEYTLEVDETIDTESIYLPPILIQPFIENAIEHGIKHMAGKGQIHLRFMAGSDKLVCEVEDNGVGRKNALEIESTIRKDHKSLATSIVKERILNLNKNLKNKIRFNIIDLKSEKNLPRGTKVVISLPLSHI